MITIEQLLEKAYREYESSPERTEEFSVRKAVEEAYHRGEVSGSNLKVLRTEVLKLWRKENAANAEKWALRAKTLAQQLPEWPEWTYWDTATREEAIRAAANNEDVRMAVTKFTAERINKLNETILRLRVNAAESSGMVEEITRRIDQGHSYLTVPVVKIAKDETGNVFARCEWQDTNTWGKWVPNI